MGNRSNVSTDEFDVFLKKYESNDFNIDYKDNLMANSAIDIMSSNHYLTN